jgi:geranylgeranyl reductase family protein
VSTDIAVIGAGPAGARAAYVLARRGARVTMFDASHPREKPCGGGVTGRALDLVAEALGRGHLDAVSIRSARFIAGQGSGRHGEPDTRCARLPLDDRALVVASRKEFDGALLAAALDAGASLKRERVGDVAVNRSGVSIRTARGTHRADLLIGADGANSLVRRRLAAMFPREQLTVATGYFVDGVTSDEIVLEFVADPPGYIWSFPRSDHLSIGICAPADEHVRPAALRQMVAAWIARSGIAPPTAALREYSWPIPSLGRQDLDVLAVAGSRWCLVGDAAGLVDPITREGIFFALASGEWAAHAVGTAGWPRHYEARVRDEAVAELASAARLKRGFFHPRFTRLVVRALSESAPIRHVMVDLIAGRQPYATLKRRLLGTLEFGLAWRTLFGDDIC